MTPVPFADWRDTFLGDTFAKVAAAVVFFVLSAVASFILGRVIGRRRALEQWRNKDFGHRLIVSLNYITANTLRIRTVFERGLDEVFLNPIAVEKVREAAAKTTEADPILPIDKDDTWFLLNFVLNAVAERFSAGFVREDAGLDVRPVTYLLCLTSEVAGPERIRKVRAMMVRREVLANFPYHEVAPQLENPWHEQRIRTLRTMATAYAADPSRFLEVNLSV